MCFGVVSECIFVFAGSISDFLYLPHIFWELTFYVCVGVVLYCTWNCFRVQFFVCLIKTSWTFSDLNSLCLSCLVFVCLFKQLVPGGRQGGWNSRQTNRNSVNSSLL